MMQVSVTGFARITGIIKTLADELCNGRVNFILEGGYNLTVLAASVKATFDILLGKTDIEDPLGQPPNRFAPRSIAPIITEVKEIHGIP